MLSGLCAQNPMPGKMGAIGNVSTTTIAWCRYSEILFLLSYLREGLLVTVVETWSVHGAVTFTQAFRGTASLRLGLGTRPPESERRTSVLTEDHCILLGEHYFIRGCIEIPVNGENDPFIWGVWVSL